MPDALEMTGKMHLQEKLSVDTSVYENLLQKRHKGEVKKYPIIKTTTKKPAPQFDCSTKAESCKARQ